MADVQPTAGGDRTNVTTTISHPTATSDGDHSQQPHDDSSDETLAAGTIDHGVYSSGYDARPAIPTYKPAGVDQLVAILPNAMCPYLPGDVNLSYYGLRTPICYYTERGEEVIYDPQFYDPERSYLHEVIHHVGGGDCGGSDMTSNSMVDNCGGQQQLMYAVSSQTGLPTYSSSDRITDAIAAAAGGVSSADYEAGWTGQPQQQHVDVLNAYRSRVWHNRGGGNGRVGYRGGRGFRGQRGAYRGQYHQQLAAVSGSGQLVN